MVCPVAADFCHGLRQPQFENHLELLIHILSLSLLAAALVVSACTQQTQDQIGGSIRHWSGSNGRLAIYAGENLLRRCIDIDKLATALGADDGKPRRYRFGYGLLDGNLGGGKNKSERRVYSEFSDDSSHKVFFEVPQ